MHLFIFWGKKALECRMFSYLTQGGGVAFCKPEVCILQPYALGTFYRFVYGRFYVN